MMVVDSIAITLDVDWAEDATILDVADLLIENRVRATWFVTHDTPVLSYLRDNADIFELGIHPNFLPGSTQGNNPREILKTCMDIVPEAVSMRTHGLVQATWLYDLVLEETPIQYDVSTYLFRQMCRPVLYERSSGALWKLSHCWEDDLEIEKKQPVLSLDRLEMHSGHGAAIFAFHPIHIALNSPSMKYYKAHMEKKNSDPPRIQTLDKLDSRQGITSFFYELVYNSAASGGGSHISTLKGC
ncbi:polysaccharide deacetylase WbmS family protein [Salidesulfovibrio brasiliensis]|uniref:polysaccharide deacetylase WbmS family protein n=1 Tax=Salidesulfovibrio brasiliensis TaxID=221711 RepID=UPI0012EDBEDD|nr:hypothetical protein [Salidesulfovibrio brasiliensis]